VLSSPSFSHEELSSVGLSHGTGAICCGCPFCRCFACWCKARDSARSSVVSSRRIFSSIPPVSASRKLFRRRC